MSQAVANHRGRKKRGWGRRERWERKGSGNLLSLVLICGMTRMGDNGEGKEHRRREGLGCTCNTTQRGHHTAWGGDWDAERREGREKKIEGRVERGKEGETDDRSSGVEG